MLNHFVKRMQRHLTPACVLLAALFVTIVSWRLAVRQAQTKIQQDFAQTTQDYRQLLERRINAYARFLDGLSGLFAVNESVSSKQFTDYIHQAGLITNYPGTNRIAYLPLVPSAQKGQHEAQMRAAGFPDYEIKSDKAQAEYFPYDYLYPMDAKVRQQLLGIDPHLRPERDDAMQKARDSGEVISTGKLRTLVMPSTTSSFIFYKPIYRAGAPLRTVFERRQALKGYVFAAFRADELIKNVFGNRLDRIATVRLFDGDASSPRGLLYDSGAIAGRTNTCSSCITHTETFNVAGRSWTLEFRERPPFGNVHRDNLPLFVLLGGIVASLLLTSIVTERNEKHLLLKQQQAQDQKFRSLFDHNPDAVYAADLNGVLTAANATTAAWAGIPASELIGKPFAQYIAPECLEAAKQRFAQALNGSPTHAELTLIDHTGKRIEVSATGVPIMVDGKVVGVFGITKDISQRKTTEEENLQMRQFLDAVLENLPTVLFVKDAQSLRFIVWNKASETLTGVPREEIIGKSVYQLFPKREADHFTAMDLKALAGDSPVGIAEETVQTRHRGTRLLHTRKVPFTMGDKQYLLGISEDVTERRQAEEALKQAHDELEYRVKQRTRALRNEIEARKESERALLESEEKYRSIFEQAPVGVAHMNLEGRWIKTNRKFCEIIGYSA